MRNKNNILSFALTHRLIYIFIIVCSVSAILFISVKCVKVTASNYNINNQHTTESLNKYYKSIRIDEGDSLWSLASVYSYEGYQNEDEFIAEVKSVNHLHSDCIHSGEYIVVPYYE